MVNKILCIMLIVAGTWLLSSIRAYAQPPHVVAQVQERLIERGYYPGPVDGVWGRRTALELRRYQMDMGLPATGELDPPTMQSLNLSPRHRPAPPPPQPYRDYREPIPGPPPSPWEPAPPGPGPRPGPQPPYPPPY